MADKPSNPPSPDKGLCAGTTKSGNPCKRAPLPDEDYCLMHHPDKSEERRALSVRGGKTTGALLARSPLFSEIERVKERLWELVEKLEAGQINSGVAATENQLLNTVLRSLDYQRTVHRQEVLEERLDEIEERAKSGAGPVEMKEGKDTE